jgi:sugar phosphate isomerase/epimerase
MILTGIADEAAKILIPKSAPTAIRVGCIELRFINGLNAAGDLSQKEFENVAEKLTAANMKVTCFASAIGNWSRHLLKDDFTKDLVELKTAVGRMHRLGTKFIRTMSWVGEGVEDRQWRDEVIRRYRQLVKIARDGDIYLAHENCTGWGGQSAKTMRQLYEAINDDHFVVLYDIGNVIAHGDQPWEFYTGIKDLVRYVHVKDARKNPAGGPSRDFAYPGEGDAMVPEILTNLISSGYDGVISIEPHLAAIAHQPGHEPDANEMLASYLKYGRMVSEIVKQASRKSN